MPLWGEIDVYSFGKLGQMYGVCGLYQCVSCQVFWNVRGEKLALSVFLLHQLWNLSRSLSLQRCCYQCWLGRLTTSVFQPTAYMRHGPLAISSGNLQHLRTNLIAAFRKECRPSLHLQRNSYLPIETAEGCHLPWSPTLCSYFIPCRSRRSQEILFISDSTLSNGEDDRKCVVQEGHRYY